MRKRTKIHDVHPRIDDNQLTQGKNNHVKDSKILLLMREQEMANNRSRGEQQLAAQRQQLLHEIMECEKNRQ